MTEGPLPRILRVSDGAPCVSGQQAPTPLAALCRCRWRGEVPPGQLCVGSNCKTDAQLQIQPAGRCGVSPTPAAGRAPNAATIALLPPASWRRRAATVLRPRCRQQHMLLALLNGQACHVLHNHWCSTSMNAQKLCVSAFRVQAEKWARTSRGPDNGPQLMLLDCRWLSVRRSGLVHATRPHVCGPSAPAGRLWRAARGFGAGFPAALRVWALS